MSTSATKQTKGVFGRGPLFWGALTLICAAIVAGLGVSGAVEGKGVALILLLAPVATFIAMMRSAYRMAGGASSACIAKGSAQQAYIKRVAIFTSLYLAGFAALMFTDESMTLPVAVKFAIALVPGLAISGVFWAMGRLIIEETDEFIRVLTIRQALIASGLALSSASIWGFLEEAELVAHVDAYWFAVIWFFGLFLGAAVNRVEHGTWGSL